MKTDWPFTVPDVRNRLAPGIRVVVTKVFASAVRVRAGASCVVCR